MQDNYYHKKIVLISVVDQIGEELKQQILNGSLKAGDKLPSEAEIARTYGVNRLSVRMALQKLNTLGVTETRVGEGSFVREFSIYPVLSEIVDFYSTKDRIEDIQQMRYIIEKESAVRAIKVATDEDFVSLKQYLQEYRDNFYKLLKCNTDENFYQLIQADFAFHAQIVHISQNIVFEEIYFMIQNLVAKHIMVLVNRRRLLEANAGMSYLKMHEDLYTSICARDDKEVRRLLEKLLDVIYTI
jgi:GntR family transcriptional regulator, transcriptional repressor for pyruvate dehydrogenase complex